MLNLVITLAAIIDPNTNITLFESGAIVSYLITTYDKSNSLTYTSSPETFHLQQWAYFQASGQGPYFGQAAWYVSIESLTNNREDASNQLRFMQPTGSTSSTQSPSPPPANATPTRSIVWLPSSTPIYPAAPGLWATSARTRILPSSCGMLRSRSS